MRTSWIKEALSDCTKKNNLPLYGEILSSSLALQDSSRKSSMRSREMRDWLNTNLRTHEDRRYTSVTLPQLHVTLWLKQTFQYKPTAWQKRTKSFYSHIGHTYTLSSTSSAMRRTSKRSTIFPECSRISASASVTNSLCQSGVGLPGAEPVGRAVCYIKSYRFVFMQSV